MKLLLIIFITLFTSKLFSQNLIIKCDTMYKIEYPDFKNFSEATETDDYEFLKFSDNKKKFIINFDKKTVKYGFKRYKIFDIEPSEPEISHIFSMKRLGKSYSVIIGDNCQGGTTLLMRYFKEQTIVCRWYPTVKLVE